MAFRYNDRVRVNCIPSGTGDISLGTVPTGYLSFADGGFSDADTTVVGIIVPGTGEFVVCEATYNSAGPSITRGTIIESSNSGANVNFAGGTAGVVFVGLSATKAVHVDMTASEYFTVGIQPVPEDATITATGTTQGTAATLTTQFTYITSGAADTGVVTRAVGSDPVGTERVVVDLTGTTKKLYPDGTTQINSLGASNPIEMAPYQSIRIRRQAAGQWYAS